MPPGRERGRLQSGEAIALADGTVVTPAQVLGEPRAGRKVLVTGDTAPSLAYLDLAQGAELLVHEATFCEEERERARETSHSTAREAAQVAAAAGVKLLALTHLSPVLRARDRARGARGVSGDGRPARLRRDRDPVPRAGAAGARQGRRFGAGAGIGIVRAEMTRMVQLAVAGDITEAEEIQEILTSAGIPSELESSLDEPLTVVVPEASLDDAKDAIEALTEPDDLIAEP